MLAAVTLSSEKIQENGKVVAYRGLDWRRTGSHVLVIIYVST